MLQRRRPSVKLTHRCSLTRKVRFRDHEEAVAFLHRACTLRKRAKAAGCQSRRREVRTYECLMCHGWHVTSQEGWAA